MSYKDNQRRVQMLAKSYMRRGVATDFRHALELVSRRDPGLWRRYLRLDKVDHAPLYHVLVDFLNWTGGQAKLDGIVKRLIDLIRPGGSENWPPELQVEVTVSPDIAQRALIRMYEAGTPRRDLREWPCPFARALANVLAGVMTNPNYRLARCQASKCGIFFISEKPKRFHGVACDRWYRRRKEITSLIDGDTIAKMIEDPSEFDDHAVWPWDRATRLCPALKELTDYYWDFE